MASARELLPLLACAGCAHRDDGVIDAALDPTIDTVVTVTWTTDLPATGRVEYGLDSGYGASSPLVPDSAGTTSHATLLGLPVDATVHYRVVGDLDGRSVVSDDYTITTGALPEQLPPLDVDPGADDTLAGDYTLFPWWSITRDRSAVYLVDRAGAVVWYWEPDWGFVEAAEMSPDNTAVVVLLCGVGGDPEARFGTIPLDGTAPIYTPAPFAHHDFVQTPLGIAYLATDVRNLDGRDTIGDKIMVIQPDGTSDEVWNAWLSLPMTDNLGMLQDPADWTHANGLGWDPTDNTFVVSLFWYEEVLKIDPATGGTAWSLGGPDDDFTFVDDAGFGPQHAPEIVDGELLLFDNAAASTSSRLVRYRVDVGARTATPTWSWQAPEGTVTRLQGDVDLLPDGGSISAWGELEQVLTVDAAGTIVRRLSLDGDGLIGQVERVDDLTPAE
jgi:hypothetical protein